MGASPAGHQVEGDFRYAGLAAEASVAHVFLGLCFTYSRKKKHSEQMWDVAQVFQSAHGVS